MTYDPAEHLRDRIGQFTDKPQSAPEATLEEQKPLTEEIAEYLKAYDDQSAAYEEDGEGYGRDADDAYAAWEDFQTDNSVRTYAMLEAAKAEIERLQAELSKAQSKYAIPAELRSVIGEDFERSSDEPLLYVPEDGQSSEGYFDVIAVVDGETTRKYTQTPDGDIDWGRA